MNECFFTGKLSNDVLLKTSKAGTRYCRFSICVRKNFRAKGDAPGKTGYEFINLSAFGGVCDYLTKHGKKGDSIAVKATARQSIIEANGKKLYSNDLVATMAEINFSVDHNHSSAANEEPVSVADFDDIDTSDITPDMPLF